jgi:hypothetical protein
MSNSSYIFDLENITNFVFGNPNEKTNEVEITEHYVYDKDSNAMIPNTKDVKEVKVNDYTGQNTIRYDLVRMFVDILDSIEDPKVLTLGQDITLNTLKAYELIKDINDNDNE